MLKVHGMSVFSSGFLTAAALVIAIGVQSAYVLKQAITRDHIGIVVATCIAGDCTLIFAGTAGVGMITEHAPWLMTVLTWLGVVYLFGFSFFSFRSAFSGKERAMNVEGLAEEAPASVNISARREGSAEASGQKATTLVVERPDARKVHERKHIAPTPRTSALTVFLTALSVSVLNPQAMVDTVVVLGSIANSFGPSKWEFAIGAMTASVVWQLLLSGGGRLLSNVLNTPRTWKIIDICVGIITAAVGMNLLVG